MEYQLKIMSSSEMTHMLKIALRSSMAAGIAAGYSAGFIAGFWVGLAIGVGLVALCVGGFNLPELYESAQLAWISA